MKCKDEGGRMKDEGRGRRKRLLVSLSSCLLVFLLFTVNSSQVTAQEAVRASVGAEVNTFNVGDVVELLVVVEHPVGYRVVLPDLDEQWGEFEVREIRPKTIIDGALGEMTTVAIDVTVWQPGQFATPELALQVATPEGTLQTVVAPPLNFTIASVLSPDDLNLRDLKPQATLPLPGRMALYVSLGALALAGIAALAIMLRRSRAAAGALVARGAAEDLRPVNVRALDTLREIEQLDLPSKGAFKQHYTLISDTVRRYLEGAFGISAMEATSYELRRTLRSDTELNVEQRAQLEKMLNESDLVKFAKATPDVDEARHFPQQARAFIESSYTLVKKVEEVEEVGEGVA